MLWFCLYSFNLNSQVISRLKGDMDKMANERASLVAELTVLRERHSDDLLALKKLQAVLEDFQQGQLIMINSDCTAN